MAYASLPILSIPATTISPREPPRSPGLAAALGPCGLLVIEVYPGISQERLVESLIAPLEASLVLDSETLFIPAEEMEARLAETLSDDRIFGRRSLARYEDFLAPGALAEARRRLDGATGIRVIHGPGASLVGTGDVLVQADVSRWELQLRYREPSLQNWRAAGYETDVARKIKRCYFFEWLVADRRKRAIAAQLDFVLDMNDELEPRLIEAEALRRAYRHLVTRPFRLMPFFDPGVWGGSWMQRTFDVHPEARNLAWSFDGVPEENSLLLGFGGRVIQLPAQNLVCAEPVALLGERVYGRFGPEFPIRFDYLDTMGGQNLSLQVHPTTEYIQHVFGMPYTQDESYYVVAAEPDGVVYLGLREGADIAQMREDLERAQEGGAPFDAERYVNRIPAAAHDHFLIPGGTIHCSGANTVILEISATPNRFTFKLWDWERVDFDGLPRPINLEHGFANLKPERDLAYAQRELINRIEPLAEGEGWRAERTGLHALEFIETVRHRFTRPVEQVCDDSVHMLTLVEGSQALISSPDDAFEPWVVHFGETFIVPAAVGRYRLSPVPGAEDDETLVTIRASVR